MPDSDKKPYDPFAGYKKAKAKQSRDLEKKMGESQMFGSLPLYKEDLEKK